MIGSAASALLASLEAPLPYLTLLLLPVLPFLRPDRTRRPPARSPQRAWNAQYVSLVMAILTGAVTTQVQRWSMERDCRLHIADGAEGPVAGWFESAPATGARPFYLVDGFGCRGLVRVRSSDPGPSIMPGLLVTGVGRWRRAGRRVATWPHTAGILELEHVELDDPESGTWLGRTRARLRGRVEVRLRALFPSTWPLASALILARKEGLDPEIRESFAVAGIAHLLAISGFHVGVVSMLVSIAVRQIGLGRRRTGMIASGFTWLYVAFIGFPAAATRAALILTFVSLSRWRTRPPGALGAVSTSLLALFLVDPLGPSRPGFQLSFAGALGLLVVAPPIRTRLDAGWLHKIPRQLKDGLAAGMGATLATAPFVAWHFGRVSLVGLPATLLAAPLVTVAIPGLLSTVFVSSIFPGLAPLLAFGTDLSLRALQILAVGFAGLPGASVWIGSVTLAGAVLGGLGGALWVSSGPHRIRSPVRSLVVVIGVVSGVIGAPLIERAVGSGTLEIIFLSVGQGDATAIRSPGGRWILVDTGPRGRGYDAGARVVVPYLRRRGVSKLEALVLTHPDLDHIGGAASVMNELDVGYVLEPARATGRDAYVDVLEIAVDRGISWLEARRGFVVDLDGIEVVVLHPSGPTGPGGDDSNAQSVVVLVRYGEFEALLTGDAPVEVEDELLADLPTALEVLKVGHHGSITSTSQGLLAHAAPALAVISVGANNRYGHPHSSVVDRLRAAGARIFRTDRNGHVRVRARKSGLYEVEGAW